MCRRLCGLWAVQQAQVCILPPPCAQSNTLWRVGGSWSHRYGKGHHITYAPDNIPQIRNPSDPQHAELALLCGLIILLAHGATVSFSEMDCCPKGITTSPRRASAQNFPLGHFFKNWGIPQCPENEFMIRARSRGAYFQNMISGAISRGRGHLPVAIISADTGLPCP